MVEEKPKRKIEKKDIAIMAGLLILGLILIFNVDIGNIDLNEMLYGEAEETDPALVELYQFSDLAGNNTINVELWLINIGDETATNITVFVRVRNDTGVVLLEGEIDTSTLLLRANETNTAYYSTDIYNSTKIYHTIEINWNGGHKVYAKGTIL